MTWESSELYISLNSSPGARAMIFGILPICLSSEYLDWSCIQLSQELFTYGSWVYSLITHRDQTRNESRLVNPVYSLFPPLNSSLWPWLETNPYRLGELRGKFVHFPLWSTYIGRQWFLSKQALRRSEPSKPDLVWCTPLAHNDLKNNAQLINISRSTKGS
jgi:hypothetical protein